MHSLTKVFVVFAAVLAVLLSGLTIAYSVNSDAILSSLRAERDLRSAAEAQLNTYASKESEARRDLATQLSAKTAESDRSKVAIDTLNSERVQLLADVRTAKVERDVQVQKLDLLSATLNTLTKGNEAFREETNSLRLKIADGTRRELDLIDRINEQDAQKQVADQEIRALREQLAEVRNAFANAKPGQIPEAVAAGAFVPGPTVPVHGRITEVRKDGATGDLLAMVNVGSNDQIKERMVMTIYRGTEFIANLHINKVDLQNSIGRIDMLGRNVAVSANDEVTTRKN